MRNYNASIIILMIKLLTVILLLIPSCEHEGDKSSYLEGYLIPNSLNCQYPAYSPDGKYIAAQGYDTMTQIGGIYIINLETYEKKFLVGGNYPKWSPDGLWIAFNGGGQEIYKIKINGDGLTQLTSSGANFDPDWSPDGEWIVYDHAILNGNEPGGIWLIRNDGSNKKYLFGYAGLPNWDHSGQFIAASIGGYTTDPRGRIYIFNLNTNAFQDSVVLPTYYGNVYPRFSPDGSRIVFEQSNGIWILNLVGKTFDRILPINEKEINDYVGGYSYGGSSQSSCLAVYDGPKLIMAQHPAFSPDGKEIVYDHFQVTGRVPFPDGCAASGKTELYHVNVDSAIALSNLK